MAHFARLAIFLRIEPILGAPHRLELEHDDAFRVPIAFENFSPPTAHNVLAAILLNGRTRGLFVIAIANRIDDIDVHNHVGGHFAK